MQLVARLIAVLLLVWSVRASALQGEDEFFLRSSREETRAGKGQILRMLADLLDGVDVGHKRASISSDNLLEGKEHHSVSEQQSQRDRKTPCNNFFWKTYSTC